MQMINHFSLNIQLLRTAIGQNQSECADSIGFKRTTWNNYEKGRSQPSLGDLLRIAKYFGVGLTYLVEQDLTQDTQLVKKAAKHKPPVSTISNLLNDPHAEYNTRQISLRLQSLEKQLEEIKKEIGSTNTNQPKTKKAK